MYSENTEEGKGPSSFLRRQGRNRGEGVCLGVDVKEAINRLGSKSWSRKVKGQGREGVDKKWACFYFLEERRKGSLRRV